MSDFEKGLECYNETGNYAQAAKYWLSAVGNNDGMAAILLGQMYLNGMPGQFGVAINLANAQKYLEQGANLTKISAVQYLVGIAYLRANNYLDAKKWFVEASIQNMPEAQYELADLYTKNHINGRGDKEAYFWLLIASQYCQRSANFLQTVKSRISKEDEQKIYGEADTCIKGTNRFDFFKSYL